MHKSITGSLLRNTQLSLTVSAALAVVTFGDRQIRAAGPSAADVRRATNVTAGLALVLGDIELPADLAAGGRMLVHWLPIERQRVRRRRQEILKRNLGGRVVIGVMPEDGHLPHPDRFVNLLVADLDALGDRAPSHEELMRVLATRGAAYLRSQGQWRAAMKPRNDRIDGWTHRFYDAMGNCVGRDRIAGFPRAVQWQHGPAMEDGCGNGKIPRIAEGRHVAVDSLSGDLVCRDAGNGALLWRVPVAQAPNADFAIVDRRIYLYFDREADEETRRRYRGGYGPLVAMDLLTGKVAKVYEESLCGGAAKPIEFEADGRRRRENPVPWFVVNGKTIVQAYGPDLVVLDRQTGRRRWQKAIDGATWFSPIITGGRVLAAEAVLPARRGRHDGTGHVRAVAAFDIVDGKQRWRNEQVHPIRQVREKDRSFRSRAEFKPMSAAAGLVLLHTSSYQFRAGGSIAVLDVADGRELWRREFQPKELYTQGSQRAVLRGGEVVVLDGLGAFRFDALTGTPLGEPLKMPSNIKRQARRNGACSASRATVDWLICNAYLYVGPDRRPQAFFGARGQCGEGVVPAHGLVFVPPASCDCGDYTRGYQALAPSVPDKPIADAARLTRGDCEETTLESPVAEGALSGPAASAWPIFLGDCRRRSRTNVTLPVPLNERWRVQVAAVRSDHLNTDRRQSERYLGALSAPVVGGGLVVVAAPETHRVLAVDASTGKRRWSFAAGGKVDSPPTLTGGLAVFGCDDGAVYALRVADGTLVWRFFAAPTDGVAMHHGHLASAFPLPGSTLVLGNAVVAVAGHHTDIGGLHCWVLDVATGRPRAQRLILADQPAVVANGVAVADADGRGFWIGRQLHLSLSLEDLPSDSGHPGPVMAFDRNGTRLRFRTGIARGGSTHGWKQAMRSGWARAHRIARDGEVAYALIDPTEKERHPVRAAQTSVLTAGTGSWRDKKILWAASVTELDNKPSYGALVKAGGHLYLGGGARDGTSGFVQVVEAKTGRLFAGHDLPARVTECGLAPAGDCLYVCCEDGTLVCFESAPVR